MEEQKQSSAVKWELISSTKNERNRQYFWGFPTNSPGDDSYNFTLWHLSAVYPFFERMEPLLLKYKDEFRDKKSSHPCDHRIIRLYCGDNCIDFYLRGAG